MPVGTPAAGALRRHARHCGRPRAPTQLRQTGVSMRAPPTRLVTARSSSTACLVVDALPPLGGAARDAPSTLPLRRHRPGLCESNAANRWRLRVGPNICLRQKRSMTRWGLPLGSGQSGRARPVLWIDFEAANRMIDFGGAGGSRAPSSPRQPRQFLHGPSSCSSTMVATVRLRRLERCPLRSHGVSYDGLESL